MSKNIKTSQFGGIGGGMQGSPFSPGKGPGSKGSNSGGQDMNVQWADDKTLESLIRRTHNEQDTSDRNIESRLTPQHQYAEEVKNYLLTPAERLREKFRAELHSYKKSLEEHADSLQKNSVEYIKEHYKPKAEHITTLEEQLKKRRKYNDEPKMNFFQYEDELPDLIQPERIHPVLSNKVIKQVLADYPIKRRNEFLEDSENEQNVADKAKYTTVPGSFNILLNQHDLDIYLDESGANKMYQNKGFYNEQTILDYPDYETLPNNHPRDEISQEKDIESQLFLPLEAQLHKSGPMNMYDRLNPDGKEKMGVEEVYPGMSFIGRNSPSPF
jgi:hypothetical protein